MNKEETTMPAAEWLNKYESMKEKLACKTDLDAHFTEKVIGSMAVEATRWWSWRTPRLSFRQSLPELTQ